MFILSQNHQKNNWVLYLHVLTFLLSTILNMTLRWVINNSPFLGTAMSFKLFHPKLKLPFISIVKMPFSSELCSKWNLDLLTDTFLPYLYYNIAIHFQTTESWHWCKVDNCNNCNALTSVEFHNCLLILTALNQFKVYHDKQFFFYLFTLFSKMCHEKIISTRPPTCFAFLNVCAFGRAW